VWIVKLPPSSRSLTTSEHIESHPLHGVAVIKVFLEIHHNKIQLLLNPVASSAVRVSKSIERHPRLTRNTKGGDGRFSRATNPQEWRDLRSGQATVWRMLARLRMYTTVRSAGAGALDWRTVCG
jgi:hypothetical protein